MPLLGHLNWEKPSLGVCQTELYCQELISGQNLETWDGTWDRFLVCRKVIIIYSEVFSQQISQIYIKSSVYGAKLKLTLTDCENITNQFASKKEVVHHQKEANVLKKFYSSPDSETYYWKIVSGTEAKQERRNCLIWTNYHDFHRGLVFIALNNSSEDLLSLASDSPDRTRRCKQ